MGIESRLEPMISFVVGWPGVHKSATQPSTSGRLVSLGAIGSRSAVRVDKRTLSSRAVNLLLPCVLRVEDTQRCAQVLANLHTT